jgi:hypothetical protein
MRFTDMMLTNYITVQHKKVLPLNLDGSKATLIRTYNKLCRVREDLKFYFKSV